MKRLWVADKLASNDVIRLEAGPSNHLINVMRLRAGAQILLFNGRDGEWLVEIVDNNRRGVTVCVLERRRPQPAPYAFRFAFAPLKVGRMDYLVQKAVEMGAGHLQPVITAHTQCAPVKDDKLQANIIEAAAQCGILCLPKLHPPVNFSAFIDTWVHPQPGDTLIYCDESDESGPALGHISGFSPTRVPALLIGPEGGFSATEHAALKALTAVRSVGLGPRILRADTAAVAAMAMIQLHWGDW